MQTETMDAAEEPSSILWGLDPLFSAFVRLYVSDILHMTESTQVPGIYFYNQHPVYRVDVLGTVVYKREREDFFCYGVDDGTGVINCLCWKSELVKDDRPSGEGGDAPGGFNVEAELSKLRRSQQERCRLDIGDLLRVRGTLKTSRQQREIMASNFYRVCDPLMELQISWMMDLPQLYRDCYDKKLQLDPHATSRDSPVGGASIVVRNFLEKNSVSRFRENDLKELLEPLVAPPSSQQLQQLLKQTLQHLQDEGVVYPKVKSPDQVYLVTSRDKELLVAILDVIREDSRREKYAEKGCHVLHILSAVRQRYSVNVSRAALQLLVQSLESSSDIISTSDSHYIAF
ncbi:CST complex subunit STN1 isoform X3 [Gouania willdenowi]|uniref:CST complex subunit STN1 isoform X3 n=1 Tax=Gouania willdenowi TaxID=441366 RepID=UPI0010541D96|nr:CST complex subunit STN1 isoform X3 [Gouania willdenowi]